MVLRRTRQRGAAKAGGHRDRGHHDEHAEHREHAAPAEEVADQAGQRMRPADCRSWRRPACARSRPGACRARPDRWSDRARPETRRRSRCRRGCAVANSSENEVAIAPRMLARPSSTRHTIISRALPNRSAAAPSTGWMIAKVKANTAAKLAAVAMLTREIVGHVRQHRIERARRQAGRKGRERNDIERRRQAAGRGHDTHPRLQRAVLCQRVELHQRLHQTPRIRAAAPCWARPTARDRDRDGFR